MFNRFRKDAKGAAAPKAGEETPAADQVFADILRQGVKLQEERLALLKDGLDKGLEFFEKFNESRLNLAFASFDVDMKKALFEVLYLLHVNDPSLAEFKFPAVELQHVGGIVREKVREETTNLYVEGAPHGVEGIANLSEVFKEEFQAHLREVFNAEVVPTSTYGFCPIVSIHSLGSIGTVGHKSRASDLDLQIQYDLEPLVFDLSPWTDQTFRGALADEAKYWVNRFRAMEKIPTVALKDPKVLRPLRAKANQQLVKIFPNLSRYLITREGNFAADLRGEKGAAIRTQVLHELMNLMKRASRLTRGEEWKQKEALLKERIQRIQDYIVRKFPLAEIYLFSASNDDYRKGNHGTTLESKESSGSAYQLILNYETLMPGIQITPMVPSHFIVPKVINDDAALYDRIIDYIRFSQLDIYKSVAPRVVNLGATPDLDLLYTAKHSGAVYWEAFKASSGNLPKATLNLLRYEMLLDKNLLKTNIQIIKDPTFFDKFVTPKKGDGAAEIEAMVNGTTGLPNWVLLEMEQTFPLLLQDPWWLRYKALKIGYGEEKGVLGVKREERDIISKNVDLAFALHVRISDIFTKPGDTRPFDTHREQVLIEFLKRAFPPISPRRTFLEHLFIGETRAVNTFEVDLRQMFRAALARVNEKVLGFNIQGESNQKEFEIWYHYYQENFEPAPNVVQRTIMNHLKVPRGRLQIGYRINEGWFFRSLQKESSVGKRFDTFGHLDHLPEEVSLREKSGFLAGLADCILNGYYGILNEGTLKETRTAVEFDAKSMDLGNRVDNDLAYLRPDTLHRILNIIMEFFPYQPYHYLDVIQKKREITEVLVFLNLFKFGRLAILSRDNLRRWYCDEYDHPEMFQNAHNLKNSVRAMVTAKPIHRTLAKFFRSRQVPIDRVSLRAWLNPNSVETSHSAQQLPKKEKEIGEILRQIILQVHQPKSAAPAAEAAPPAE